MKKKRSSKKCMKWIAWLIAIVVLLGIAGGGVMLAIRARQIREEKQTTQESEIPAGATVTDGEGNKLASGVAYPMPRALTYAATTAGSQEAGEGITVKATVSPAEAANKGVSFSLAFKNAESEWAKDKDVSDYFKLEPQQAPGEAKLYCLAPFGEQLVLTAASVLDPEITATCTIDYLQKAYFAFGDLKIALGQKNVVVSLLEGTAGGAVSYDLVFSDTYTIPIDEDLTIKEINLFADPESEKYICYKFTMQPAYATVRLVTYGNQYLQEDGTYKATLQEGDSILFDRSFFQKFGMVYFERGWNGGLLLSETILFTQMSEEKLAEVMEWLSEMVTMDVLWTVSVKLEKADGTQQTMEADILWDR